MDDETMSHHLAALAETPERIGDRRCAADLTVRDMLVLAEVALVADPGQRREAARHALAAARRASWDSIDPEWVTPTTWALDHRRVPSRGRALRVRDCDGHLWERRHVLEDGDVFEADAWSPAVRPAQGAPYLVHTWCELIAHYSPLTQDSSQGWPKAPPLP